MCCLFFKIMEVLIILIFVHSQRGNGDGISDRKFDMWLIGGDVSMVFVHFLLSGNEDGTSDSNFQLCHSSVCSQKRKGG